MRKRRKTTVSAKKIQPPASGEQHHFRIVLAVALVILIAKTWMAYNTVGTNDSTDFKQVSDLIRQHGTFGIYARSPVYVQPPLISFYLKFLGSIEAFTGLSFVFLFRFFAIVFDFGSIIVIWKLLEHYRIKDRFLIGMVCVLSPVPFLVVGFHGNTDGVLIFFMLLTIYCAEKNRLAWAGLVFGLSMCVKLIPVITIPVYWFMLNSYRDRLRFFLCASVVPLATFTPYWIHDSQSIMRNVLQYGSVNGIWGLNKILGNVAASESIDVNLRKPFALLFLWHVRFGKPIIMIAIALAAYKLNRIRLTFLSGIFAALSIFLIISPGFGIQYLFWLTYPAIMTAPSWGIAYSLCAGFFVFRVYNIWCGGLPLYYADSTLARQWTESDRLMDYAVWIIILLMFVRQITIWSTARKKGV